MTSRRLTLKKDTLTELTNAELASVAGAGWDVPTVHRCDTLLTGMYPTLPVTDCLPQTH